MMQTWAGLADGQIVSLALSGSPDAYSELVRRHQSAVYNVAYRLVGDREEALDLTQEAFVRAYNALPTFDTSRPFGPWINRIATNLALNALQRRRSDTVSIEREPAAGGDGEPEPWPLPDYSGEPERVYLTGEQHALLRRAILSLPARHRAVIELRHFQDRTYEEIAETLAMPLSDVKSYLFRARRQLRKWLEENS